MSQPANVATPAIAATGPLFVHPRTAPAGVVMERVTPLTSVAMRLPPRSCTDTAGCWAKLVPPVAAVLGWVVNARRAAEPVETVMPVLVAGPRSLAACNV